MCCRKAFAWNSNRRYGPGLHNLAPTEGSHRRPRLALRRAKGAEVVFADQPRRRSLDGGEIECAVPPADAPMQQPRPRSRAAAASSDRSATTRRTWRGTQARSRKTRERSRPGEAGCWCRGPRRSTRERCRCRSARPAQSRAHRCRCGLHRWSVQGGRRSSRGHSRERPERWRPQAASASRGTHCRRTRRRERSSTERLPGARNARRRSKRRRGRHVTDGMAAYWSVPIRAWAAVRWSASPSAITSSRISRAPSRSPIS